MTSFGAASSLGYVEYRVSTGRADAFNTQFLIDGGTNTSAFRNTGDVLPNPDAVAEFRLIRNMTAEYGKTGGRRRQYHHAFRHQRPARDSVLVPS